MALLLAVACWLASCIISPKDYPLDSASFGGDANGGDSDGVGAAGRHEPSGGGAKSGNGGDGGSPARAGSSNGGSSSTLAGTGGTAPQAGTSNAGSGGQLGNGGTAGAAGGGGVDPACIAHPISPRQTWTASASSSSVGAGVESDQAYNPPEHLIDGNLNERWSSGKAQAGDEWIQIDFGATVALSSVTLAAGADTNDYPRAYALRLSASALDFAAPLQASGNGQAGDNTITLTQVATGRYLTIKQTGTPGTGLSWWSIGELTVTCGPAPPGGCSTLPSWETKAYSIGDQVRSVCGGAFATPCPAGEQHTFECNPQPGAAALPWCQQRQPGISNAWAEAWVDKGKCP